MEKPAGSHSKRFVKLEVASGAVVWEKRVCDGVLQHAVKVDASLEAGAALSWDQKMVFVGCYDGCLYALRVSDGERVWTYAAGDAIKNAPLTRADDVVFGSHDRHVHCVGMDGLLKWRSELDGAVFASPQPHDGHQCRIVAATLAGSLYGLDGGGAIVWRWRGTSPIFGSPAIIGNKALFGCVDGTANAVHLDGRHDWGVLGTAAKNPNTQRGIFAAACA